MEVIFRGSWPYDVELKAPSRATNFLSGLNFEGFFSRYEAISGTFKSYKIGDTIPCRVLNCKRYGKTVQEAPISAWNSESTLACVFSDSIHLFRHSTPSTIEPTDYERIVPLDRAFTNAEWINNQYLLLSSNSGFSVFCASSSSIVCSFQGATSAVHAHWLREEDTFQLIHTNDRILKRFSPDAVCLSQAISDAPIQFIASHSYSQLKSLGVDRKIIISNDLDSEEIDERNALSNLFSISTMQKKSQSSRPVVYGSVLDVEHGLQLQALEWSNNLGPSPVSIGPFASHPSMNTVAFADSHSPTVYLWKHDSIEFDLDVFRLDTPSTRVIGLAFVSANSNIIFPSVPLASDDTLLYVLLGEVRTDPLSFLAPASSAYHNMEVVVLKIRQPRETERKLPLDESFMAKMKADLFQLALSDVDLEPPPPTVGLASASVSNDMMAQILQSMAAMSQKIDDIVISQNRIEMKLDLLSEKVSRFDKPS